MGTMPSPGAVEQPDATNYGVARLFPGDIDPPLDPFALKQLKETPGDCLVMGVTTPVPVTVSQEPPIIENRRTMQ